MFKNRYSIVFGILAMGLIKPVYSSQLVDEMPANRTMSRPALDASELQRQKAIDKERAHAERLHKKESAPKQAHLEELKAQEAARLAHEVEINTIRANINLVPAGGLNYNYGYETDVNGRGPQGKKFNEDNPRTVVGTTRDWFVLINVHDDRPINLTNVFSPDKNQLPWGTPYENALFNMKATTKGGIHDLSALLSGWTNTAPGQLRGRVSFILVPPGSPMEFAIGTASPQEGKEFRPGQGMQMRLKGLPAGVIILDQEINAKPTRKGGSEEKASFGLQPMLEKAITDYNKVTPAGTHIPTTLAKPEHYRWPAGQHVNTNRPDVISAFHMNVNQ
jgi:hypothetical protein